jgi:hypothetical protein
MTDANSYAYLWFLDALVDLTTAPAQVRHLVTGVALRPSSVAMVTGDRPVRVAPSAFREGHRRLSARLGGKALLEGRSEGLDLVILRHHTGECPVRPAVPVAGVAFVGLDHVNDAVAPGAEIAWVRLGDGVGPVPVPGFEQVERSQ